MQQHKLRLTLSPSVGAPIHVEADLQLPKDHSKMSEEARAELLVQAFVAAEKKLLSCDS